MGAESTSTEYSALQSEWAHGSIVGGGLLALFGLVALFSPFLTGVALSVLLGGLLVVGALVHVAAAFSAGSMANVVWQIGLGVVYGFAGISVLANPILGLTTLTLLFIAFFLVEGVVQLGWAVTGDAGSRLWFGASGVVSLLLAGLLWSGFPASSLWAVGVLFGVNLLVTGVGMIMYGRNQRVTTTTDQSMGTA